MDQKTKNEFGAAFQQWVDDLHFEENLDKEFHVLSLPELLWAMMDEDQKSIRKLTEMVGISPG